MPKQKGFLLLLENSIQIPNKSLPTPLDVHGMILPGVITNVTGFGAFVDIGVHQDGLIHISQLANRFISDPNTVVQVNQQVRVTVLEVDIPRRRIALSMKAVPSETT